MAHNSLDPASSIPVDARIVRTRAALNATLLTLLEQKPFDQITIREIARDAGIGYATFFRHYPTKEALLHDLAADQIRELLTLAFPILYEADSHAAAVVLCTYVAERRVLWSALLTGGAAGMMREEFVRQARQIAAGWPAADMWLPTELAVIYGVAGTVEILAWWLQQGTDFPVDRIAAILDRLVITPVLAR